MDDSGPTASILFFAALLLIDLFFYGFGAALNSLNEKEVERRAEEKDRRAIRLKKIIGSPTEYVNTVQMITTLINVIIGAVHLGILLHAMEGGLEFLTRRQIGRAHV